MLSLPSARLPQLLVGVAYASDRHPLDFGLIWSVTSNNTSYRCCEVLPMQVMESAAGFEYRGPNDIGRYFSSDVVCEKGESITCLRNLYLYKFGVR